MITLYPLARFSDASLFLMRLVIGAFLIWGVMDNITSKSDMQDFVEFLRNFGFSYPEFMAPLSVWAQFSVGIAFITGFLIRWAGIVCVMNFLVAIVMVDAQDGIRAAFPSTCLVLIGLFLATHGGGRYGVDNLYSRKADLNNS